MKKTLIFLSALILVLSSAAVAWAFINPGFETGDLTGWTKSSSNISVVTSGVGGISPSAGNYMAEIYGSAWLSRQWLSQKDSGLTSFSFDYCLYLPDEPPNDQPAFKVDLITSAGTSIILSVNDPAAGTQIINWNNFTHDLGDYAGELELKFYAGNTKNQLSDPYAYIDNVTGRAAAAVTPIPEPATISLLGISLLSLVGLRKKGGLL